VGLIITDRGQQINLMTVSFFSEVAHHPTALWVSIARSAYTHDLIEETGRFTLAVLHDGQKELALKCGSVSGRSGDKSALLPVHRSENGHLYPEDALASAACRIRRTHALGDHTLYIADILAGEVETRRNIRRHLLTTDLA
jgi:flavin reductase (DIM6/NTAB) family NADH-FMN oxidoreductase RutF